MSMSNNRRALHMAAKPFVCSLLFQAALALVIKAGIVPALDVKILVVGLLRHDEAADQEDDEAAPAHGGAASLVAADGHADANQQDGPSDPGQDLPVLVQLRVFALDVQEATDHEVGTDDQAQDVQDDGRSLVVGKQAHDAQGARSPGQAKVENVDKFALQASCLLKISLLEILPVFLKKSRKNV